MGAGVIPFYTKRRELHWIDAEHLLFIYQHHPENVEKSTSACECEINNSAHTRGKIKF